MPQTRAISTNPNAPVPIRNATSLRDFDLGKGRHFQLHHRLGQRAGRGVGHRDRRVRNTLCARARKRHWNRDFERRPAQNIYPLLYYKIAWLRHRPGARAKNTDGPRRRCRCRNERRYRHHLSLPIAHNNARASCGTINITRKLRLQARDPLRSQFRAIAVNIII